MTNYIEQLKGLWKSTDLCLIATFKKINIHSGFFYHFTNSITKAKLYYPIFDEVDILDKRVSFYYGNGTKLIDGDYYKVELEHTDNPKGKNNPYSLKIKDVSALNQESIKKLLDESKKNDSESTTYFGRYHKASEKFASFDNVMFSESGEILMSEGESQKVFVSPNISLNENTYYSFSIK